MNKDKSSKMSLSTILRYNKPEMAEQNKILLEIARKVVNSSPEPKYKIKLRDEVLTMKEKERLGFNFNRSVRASLKSRWDVVEKATVDYLEEIMDMNSQIEDDHRKYETQLINLIVTRTTNLSLDSRIEQMAGLFMHMNFYSTVLKIKIQQLEPVKQFIFACNDLLGFSRPSQLIDRYAALQHVFSELYGDYETRQNQLNQLSEALNEVKAETSHRNMLMHNQMANLHDQLKHIQNECVQMEGMIQEQMDFSTGTNLEIYKIRNAVYNIYVTMMSYRGLEATEIDSFRQLEDLDVRIAHTQVVVKELLAQQIISQRKRNYKRKQDKDDSSVTLDEADSCSSRSDENLNASKTRSWHTRENKNSNRNETKIRLRITHDNKNLTAIESVSFDAQKLRPADVRDENSSSVRSRATRCEKFDAKRSQSHAESVYLPPINVTGSLITAVTQDEAEQQKLADRLRLLDDNSNILIWRDAFKARRKVRSECAANSNTVIWPEAFGTEGKLRSECSSDANSNMVITCDGSRKRGKIRSEGGSFSDAESQSCNLMKRSLKMSATTKVNNCGVSELTGYRGPCSESWAETIRSFGANKARSRLVPIEEIPRRGSSDELRQAKPCSGSSKEQEKQVSTPSESENEESENSCRLESKIGEGVMQKKDELETKNAEGKSSATVPDRKSVSRAVNVPGTKLGARNKEKTHTGKTRVVKRWIGRQNLRENCLDILSKVKLRSSPRK